MSSSSGSKFRCANFSKGLADCLKKLKLFLYANRFLYFQDHNVFISLQVDLNIFVSSVQYFVFFVL